jgi:hypothetical protein
MSDLAQLDKLLANAEQAGQAAIPTADQVTIANADILTSQPSFIEPKADIVYGATDAGKTTQVGYASDYVLSKYGLLTRLATADGGGVGPLSGLAKSGQMEVWNVRAWVELYGKEKQSIAIKAMHRAVQGYWPVRTDDPESPLMAPDDGTFEIYGLWAFEGITSWGDTILQNLKDERASLSQEPSYVFNQGGLSFSGGNQSYYGFIQDQLANWVTLSHQLRARKVLWTALESKGEDTDGVPTYGPAIAGRKAFKKVPNWFCNCLHIDIVNKPAKEIVDPNGTKLTVSETERIMWLKTHADPMTKINFPAKVRVPVAYKDQVKPYIIPPNIADVYRLIDRLETLQQEESTKQINEIEGVRERLLKAAAVARERQEKLAIEKAKRMGTMATMVTVPGVAAVPAAPKVAVPAAASNVPTGTPTPMAPIAQPGSVPQIQTIPKKRGPV